MGKEFIVWKLDLMVKNESFAEKGALCQIGLMSFTEGMGRDRQMFAISALFAISIRLCIHQKQPSLHVYK